MMKDRPRTKITFCHAERLLNPPQVVVGSDNSRAVHNPGGQVRHIAFQPYAESNGSGNALVLRDGKSYQARWSRPTADGGTSCTASDGRPMTFAPGSVWILLTQ